VIFLFLCAEAQGGLPCRAGLLWFSPKKQTEFKGDFDFPLENPLETSRVATLHPGEDCPPRNSALLSRLARSAAFHCRYVVE